MLSQNPKEALVGLGINAAICHRTNPIPVISRGPFSSMCQYKISITVRLTPSPPTDMARPFTCPLPPPGVPFSPPSIHCPGKWQRSSQVHSSTKPSRRLQHPIAPKPDLPHQLGSLPHILTLNCMSCCYWVHPCMQVLVLQWDHKMFIANNTLERVFGIHLVIEGDYKGHVQWSGGLDCP